MMFESQKQIFNIKMLNGANWFIYWLKRLPLIGKHISDDIYGNEKLKKTISGIVLILKMVGKLLANILITGLMILLPIYFIEKNISLQFNQFVHIFILQSFLFSFINSTIFDSNKTKYICIRLMRMEPRKYILSTLLFDVLSNILCDLIVVMVLTLWMNGTVLQALILTIITTVFQLVGEAFFVLVFDKFKGMLTKKPLFYIIVIAIALAISYIPIAFHKPFPIAQVIFNPIVLVIVLVVGILIVSYLVRYKKYSNITNQTLLTSKFKGDSELKSQALFSDVVIKEKEFSESELNSNRFNNRKGFDYLNAIFFARHKKLLVRPVLIRCGIVLVAFVITILIGMFNKEEIAKLNNPGIILPAFVFVMYFISIGQRVCRAMFYNCDNSLLQYQFYRDKKAVLSNFKVRLCRVSGLNLIIGSVISVAIVSLNVIFKLKWNNIDTVSFVCSILLLSIFFSVHHLFLYYVFQPYSVEGEMKNPFYSAINWVVYFVCYFCSQIKSPPAYFSLIVLSATIIYIAVALVLVYKYAPKTFRVK